MGKTTNKFSPEVRERAVRMVGEHPRSRLGMESDHLDCQQVRFHGGDVALLVPGRGVRGRPRRRPMRASG